MWGWGVSDLFGHQPVMIPVISLWQPWASLCFVEDPDMRKLDETRHWQFPERHRGVQIAIHAALKKPTYLDEGLEDLCSAVFGADFRSDLPRGGIIGTTTLMECRPTSEVRNSTTAANLLSGNFDDFTMVNGRRRPRFAWRLSSPQALPVPIPEKGLQGWWYVERVRLAA